MCESNLFSFQSGSFADQMKCTVLKQKEVVELMKTEVNKVAEVVDVS